MRRRQCCRRVGGRALPAIRGGSEQLVSTGLLKWLAVCFEQAGAAPNSGLRSRLLFFHVSTVASDCRVKKGFMTAVATAILAFMKKRGWCARRTQQVLGGLLLALCSGATLALGLGDIRVLSRPGEPLLAEIPVVSNEPGDLEQLLVALASPETFARVGLARPKGLVADLQFAVSRNAGGRAVIRVTSRRPVAQPVVGFLVEVNWGRGRLVREYTALLDAPSTTLATEQSIIEGPALDESNAIARDADKPAEVAELAAQSVASKPAVPAAVSPQKSVSEGGAAAPPSVAAAVSDADKMVLVRAGQTLWGIATDLAQSSGVTHSQAMLGLLRANPDAFIGGNINRLKRGVVLHSPEQQELVRVGAAEAALMVREQIGRWQQAGKPIPQPADSGVAPAPAAATTAAPASPASAARLQITPAVASDAGAAATTSGTSAEGEGDMLIKQELEQAREEIATRDAEIHELRARVDELEALQKQQQQLIALKNADLAKAQRSNVANEPGSDSSMWLWAGMVLVVAALAGWLMSRRRKPSPLPPRSYHALQSAQPSFAVATAAAAAESVTGDAGGVGEHAPAPPSDDQSISQSQVPAMTAANDDPAASSHGPQQVSSALQPLSSLLDEAARPAAKKSYMNGRDQIELAIAYSDLGDPGTARRLLQEVADGDDSELRVEALELLSRIG
jgi:pilus assembly protein FimV